MYYSLNFSAIEKDTGTYPQLELLQAIFKNNSRPEYEKINTDEQIDYVKLEGFCMANHAIKTDVLSSNILSNNLGLFLNEKTKEILTQYGNEYLRFFPVVLERDNYFFMHLIDNKDVVDYSKSKFSDMLNKGSVIKSINSFEDYVELKKSRKHYPRLESISLRKPLDIFRLPYDVNIIISENLKSELINKNITGIEIKPYTFYTIV